jgi:cysteine synthase B
LNWRGRAFSTTPPQAAFLALADTIERMKIIDTIGETPQIEISTGVARPDIRLFGKLEGNNPAGSVKDRPARAMILGAEARAELRPGVRLIEPTSGNTGIALAMVAAARGYAIELVMPDNATAERVHTMQAYGAEVILTPAAEGMEAAIDHAREKVARGGYLMLDQFSNPDNWRAHYETTGPEIWRDTDHGVTHFVSAMGTTGTIMGVSRYLKEQNKDIQIVGCQPADGSQIPGIRCWPEAYLPKIYDRARVDRVVEVTQLAAEQTTRGLAREQGIFVGTSAGGAVWAARKVCQELDAAGRSGLVICILCDRGDRYISSPLFNDVSSDKS